MGRSPLSNFYHQLVAYQLAFYSHGLKHVSTRFWLISPCLNRSSTDWLRLSYSAGVPNLWYVYPLGYICLSEGVYLRIAIEGKIYLYIIYFQIFIHISVNTVFNNHYLYSNENVKVLFKFNGFCYLLRPFVIRNIMGTCSSVEMLKGTWSEKGWEPLLYREKDEIL